MKIQSFRNIVSIACLAALPLVGNTAPDPNFHIYLMIGQSNMEGQGAISSQDRTEPNGVMVLQNDECQGNSPAYHEWRPATPPLIRCYEKAHSWNSGGLGPGDYFGRTMGENAPSGVTIGLVGAAYQGKKIEFFMRDCGANCNDASDFPTGRAWNWLISGAKRAQEDGVIKGIIFHQGESNSGEGNAWLTKLSTFTNDIRTELGLGDDVPMIIGELVGPCCTGHNSTIRNVGNVVTNGHWVQGADLSRRDEYHFDAAGYRTIGQRYAEKMLEVVNLTSEPLDCGTTSNGNPRCCDIASDPDGDGWGTQNDGESCEVDSDTTGWNPADIAAAINVGSTSGDSYSGVYYSGDQYFSGGTANSSGDTISGANGSSVMQSERYGEAFSYEIPLDNGNYSVELNLVELYHESNGSRSFSIAVEGQQAVSDIDLFQQVGHDVLYTPPLVSVALSDGSLTVEVTRTDANSDNGTLSGIVVRHAEAPASSSSSAPQSSSSSSSSSSSNSSSSSSSSSGSSGGASGWLLLLLAGMTQIRRSRRAA